MSAIAGIFHRDGAPADRALLRALLRFLSPCGPDGRQEWCDGPLAFGCAILQGGPILVRTGQLTSLEGIFTLVADARLDAREELRADLRGAGRAVAHNAPDFELILQSYAAWGEGCLDRLRGDFSFAVWDARARALFCARDHFGVKPFFYACPGDSFLFSSALDCVRLNPEVADDLNELAVGDFLLFGLNYDVATTTFRDIRRLPPGHFLRVSREGLRVARYWSPPVNGRIRYANPGDYTAHFRDLFRAAVADRLPESPCGILLSGGLDSSSVAAMACKISPEAGGKGHLRAYTVAREAPQPASDETYARSMAEFLGIPLRVLRMEGIRPFEDWDGPEWRLAEPVEDPSITVLFQQFHALAEDCRVVFNGEGADNLMHFKMWPYVRDLARHGEWCRGIAEISRYLWLRPFPWRGLRYRAAAFWNGDRDGRAVPKWIAPDFAARLDLEARARECGIMRVSPAHPVMPTAHASMSLPHWTQFFELQSPGFTRCPVEVRFPFLDLRIVNYLLALPPFPWAFQKTLLRQAMAGDLPESVRRRPKTPMADDSMETWQELLEAKWLETTPWSEQISRFVDRSALGAPGSVRGSERARASVRPFCLNFWLRSSQRIRYNLVTEARNA